MEFVHKPCVLADHVATAIACNLQLANRFKALHELRAKDGRVLSSTNRKMINAFLDSIRLLACELESMLATSEPVAAPTRRWLPLRSNKRAILSSSGMTCFRKAA